MTTAESELIAANLLPRFSPLDFNPTLVDQELPAAEVVLPGGKLEAKDHIVEVVGTHIHHTRVTSATRLGSATQKPD